MYRYSLVRICTSSFASHFGASLSSQKKTGESHAEEEQLATGAPFNNVTFKPFPVRAAIDVNNGQVTLAVARVDAKQRAIRDLMFQSQLPVHIEFESNFSGEDGTPIRTLTQSSQNDLLTKCRILIGSIKREGPGVTEVAGLLAWPFYDLHDGGAEIANALTVSLKVDFRVVGQGGRGVEKDPKAKRLERLRKRAMERGSNRGKGKGEMKNEEDKDFLVPVSDALSPEEELNQLAFLAIAAGAKVVDRSRMVAVIEQPATLRSPDGSLTSQFCGGGIQLVGTIDDEDFDAVEGNELPSSAAATCKREGEHQSSKHPSRQFNNASKAAAHWAPLQRYQLPIDTMGTHSMLLRDIQKREESQLHSFSSPNPVHRHEAKKLRDGLCRMLVPQIPLWVRRKLQEREGILVGASENGGLLNVAARLVGKPYVGADVLEQQVDYGMCGLTDVLMGHNMPTPQLVVPQACLAVSLIASCGATRAEYIPRVSLAQAILVHPAYWAYSRRDAIEAALRQDRWYTSESQRTFGKPITLKHDPNGSHRPLLGVNARTPSIARY